jgi:hypothetical protein
VLDWSASCWAASNCSNPFDKVAWSSSLALPWSNLVLVFYMLFLPHMNKV